MTIARILTVIGIIVFMFGNLQMNAYAKTFNQKIVIFNDNVKDNKINNYIRQLEKKDVSVKMNISLINGIILNVPSEITNEELADNSIVNSVEDDQQVQLKSQYAKFILPVEKPPAHYYPWGVLKLYGQRYDRQNFLSEYSPESLSELLKSVFLKIEKNQTKLLEKEQKKYKKDKKEQEHKKIKIAIFDTGIQYYHSRLFNLVQDGFDTLNRKNIPLDDNGHGTHVAGIVASIMDKSGEWGRQAFVELYPVKILKKDGTGDLSNIIIGLQWAFDNEIDVVNMSVGFRKSSRAVRKAIKAAYAEGIVMIASVGNRSNYDDSIMLSADGASADGASADGASADGASADGASADGASADGASADGASADGASTNNEPTSLPLYKVMYPARYSEVISVGASTLFGKLASYSNKGKNMDLIAPGSDIVSTDVTNGNELDGFGISSGTSQAAPHVTAAVAIMLALEPSLKPDEIKNILIETATKKGRYLELNLIGALEKVNAME